MSFSCLNLLNPIETILWSKALIPILQKTSAGVNLPVVIPVSKKTPGPFGCPQNLFEMDDREEISFCDHTCRKEDSMGAWWVYGRRSGTFWNSAPKETYFRWDGGYRAGPDFLPTLFCLVYFLVNIQLGVRKKLCGLWWQEGPAGGFGQFPFPLGPQHRPLKWVCSRTWLLEPLAAEVYASQRRWWFQESWEGKVALGCWWDWPISPESPHNTGFRATSVSVAAWQISHAGNSGLYYHTRWIGSFSGLGLNRHCQFIFRSQNGPLQPWTCLQWSVLILNNTFQTWKCSIKLTCELDLPRLVLGIK